MGKVKISFDGFKCERCEHQWVSRKKEIRVCPKCKSPYWNSPRTIKIKSKGKVAE